MEQDPMDEFMDFVDQLHRQDDLKAAEEKGRKKGTKEGRKEGMTKLKNGIKSFLRFNPNSDIKDVAAMFGVDEQMVKGLIPGRLHE